MSQKLPPSLLTLGPDGVAGWDPAVGFYIAPPLLNGAFLRKISSELPTGDNMVYTVPVGRQAYIGRGYAFYNTSGGSITAYPEIEVGGVLYMLNNPTTMGAGTGANPNFNTGLVLQAGESFGFNVATTSGLNANVSILEWDVSDTSLVTGRVLGLAAGFNELISCPAGSVLVPSFESSPPQSWGVGNVQVMNNTGGAVTYYPNNVPAGATPGVSNQTLAAAAVGNQTNHNFACASVLTAGDALYVNASAGDTGGHQIAWATYFQVGAVDL